MTVRRPVVLISGSLSELPPGDTAAGVAATLLINPSGLLSEGGSLGIDGVALVSGQAAQVTANTALASGNAGIVTANTALASGNAGIVTANTALASGNAGISEALLRIPTSDIGVTVQAYDADTAKLDVVQTFTAAQTFNAGASDSAGNYRIVPQNSKTSGYTLVASDTGKHISITTGGITVPASVFSAGDVVSIYNNSGSNQTITQGSSTTLRQAGTANTGNRTLAQYGLATILCVASNTFVISGTGLS